VKTIDHMEELFPVRPCGAVSSKLLPRPDRGGHDLLLSLRFASLKSVGHLRFGLPSVAKGEALVA
jgi:hypothetical protein